MKSIHPEPAVPVVDLFAGPGGLGEGFSAFESAGLKCFDVRLSIEKDPVACATLTLRKFFRQFEITPPEFEASLSGQLSRPELYGSYPSEAAVAHGQAWKAELGRTPADTVFARLKQAIGGHRNWILLGGPPCQAYSMAGRSRMRGVRGDFEDDERHLLYREYLRIVADHEPAIFVLENVKGLLTSNHGGRRIITRIINDLGEPGKAVNNSSDPLRYRLYALGPQQEALPWMEELPPDGEEFLLQAEKHGIPQNRHRLFIIGVRSDVSGRPATLPYEPEVSLRSVLADLPPIRGALSRGNDSLIAWRGALAAITDYKWMGASPETELGMAAGEVRKVLRRIARSELDTGRSYIPVQTSPRTLNDWYRHRAMGITHHESRAHMRDDFHRYLFCACFAAVHGRSPKIRDFPTELYPSHRNVSEAVDGNMFDDRFRVQLPDQPSTTITSHVSKDGHYYIHYDAAQCRSLTVREAARLQTFPDSYYFEGARTEQYHQIGNAVPPLLAMKIAGVVHELLIASGCARPVAPSRRRIGLHQLNPPGRSVATGR
jgi:DNA (cytosine-5)-methyltransferase 1